jgi:hypothetical protein
MAYAMIGGIIVGTGDAVFLPALYVAWFRIKEPVALSSQQFRDGNGQP